MNNKYYFVDVSKSTDTHFIKGFDKKLFKPENICGFVQQSVFDNLMLFPLVSLWIYETAINAEKCGVKFTKEGLYIYVRNKISEKVYGKKAKNSI